MNYAKGTFGYWWTVVKGNNDIAGQIYNGNIDASNSGITSCKGMPEEVTGSLYLSGCTSLTALPDRLTVGGSLYLSGCTSLTTLPENLNVGGLLYLSGCTSLTALPDRLTVGGSLNLSGCTSLTTLPENLNVGGLLDLCDCTSLTKLPNNLSVKGSLYLSGCTSLTALPDRLTVGGSLYLSGCTSLTTLPENLNVGGLLDLSGCTSLTTLPDRLTVGGNIYGEVYRWRGSMWSFFDGVQKEVKSVKKTKELTVYKMVDGTFCVYDGEHYSHGATLQEAKDDLIYKHSTRDLSKFKSLTLESKLTFADAVELYRSITGACTFGTREFVKSHNISKRKKYTVAKIIELTNGQYNSQKLAEFFNNKGE